MASKGLTMVPLLLIIAALIEIIGGVALLVGFRTRIAGAILLLYLIPVTLIMHDFWNLAGPDRQQQIVEFLKNLGIFGGLFYVISVGSGRFSMDACCTHTHTRIE